MQGQKFFDLPQLQEQPDVLLVQPPQEYQLGQAGAGEPLGLELLATILRQRGYTVKVLDTCILNMDLGQIVTAMHRYRPKKILGFSIHIMDMFLRVQEILACLHDSYHQLLTVVGGHAPTFWYQHILENCPSIDIVVRVEGEGAILDLIDFVEGKTTLEDIEGIVYRTSDGQLHLTPPRRLLSELSTLPRIQRDTLAFGMEKMELAPELQTSRGCFGTCNFCSLNSFYHQHPGPKIRLQTVPTILDEISDLYHNFGARFFRFADDTFFTSSRASHERTKQIADGILERELDIRFVIQLRADAVDASVLNRLKEAGLELVMIGIEALDEETLDLYGKHTSIDDNYRAAQILADLNIRFRACYITFNPYTKISHLRNSIRFFRSLTGPHQCDHIFNRLFVLHGTPMERKLNDAGVLHLRSAQYQYDYDFQNPQIAQIWKYCEFYLPIFTPVKREIGALWEWWFQHYQEAQAQFEIELEHCEHDLTNHHLYFLENLVDWAEGKINLDTDWLLSTMQKRVSDVAQGLEKIKKNQAEQGISIQLNSNYVFDPSDLTYGLEDDLRGQNL